MKTQSVTGLDPGSWYAVYPPIRARRCSIVNDVTLLFRAQAADPSITLYAGANNSFTAEFTVDTIAFYLKPLSGSPEPGLIWS